jgi:lysophospholipase L1-like esterase
MVKKVVFFGDSLNKGIGGESWTSMIPSKIGTTTSENYAVSGSKSNNLGHQVRTYTENNPQDKQGSDVTIYSILTGGNDLLNYGWPQITAGVCSVVSTVWLSIVEFQLARHPINTFSHPINSLKYLVLAAVPAAIGGGALAVGISIPKNQEIGNAIHKIQEHNPENQNAAFLVFTLPNLNKTPIGEGLGDKLLTHILVPQYISDVVPVVNGLIPASVSGYVHQAALIAGELVAVNMNVATWVATTTLTWADAITTTWQLGETNTVTVISLDELQSKAASDASFNPNLSCLVNQGCNNGRFFDDKHPSIEAEKLFATFVAETVKQKITMEWTNSEAIQQFKTIASNVKKINFAFEGDSEARCSDTGPINSEIRKSYLEKIASSLSIDGSNVKLKMLIVNKVQEHKLPADFVGKVQAFESAVTTMIEKPTDCTNDDQYLELSGELIKFIDHLPS